MKPIASEASAQHRIIKKKQYNKARSTLSSLGHMPERVLPVTTLNFATFFTSTKGSYCLCSFLNLHSLNITTKRNEREMR